MKDVYAVFCFVLTTLRNAGQVIFILTLQIGKLRVIDVVTHMQPQIQQKEPEMELNPGFFFLLFFFLIYFIYLDVPGLKCGMWDLL